MRFFAWQIFRLTHLTFRPQKRETGSAQRALSSLGAFQLTSLQEWDSQPPGGYGSLRAFRPTLFGYVFMLAYFKDVKARIFLVMI